MLLLHYLLYMLLAKKNSHERDHRIRFVEDGHKYYIDEKTTGWVSTTGFVKQFCTEFQARFICKNMIRSRNFPTLEKHKKYLHLLCDDNGQKHDEETLIDLILQQWDDAGKEACRLGTLMHEAIELYYNGIDVDLSDTPEKRMFQEFDKEIKKQGYVPFRTEWYVFDEKEHICGAIDFVMYRPDDDTYHIFDWKRSKQIKRTGNRMKYCLGHLRDCNFMKYSLQLNVYKYILETNYGITVASMALVVLHPNQQRHLVYNVLDLQEEVVNMLDHHRHVNRPIPIASVFPDPCRRIPIVSVFPEPKQ